MNQKCPRVYILMLRLHAALCIFHVKLKKQMKQKELNMLYIPLQEEVVLLKAANDPY